MTFNWGFCSPGWLHILHRFVRIQLQYYQELCQNRKLWLEEPVQFPPKPFSDGALAFFLGLSDIVLFVSLLWNLIRTNVQQTSQKSVWDNLFGLHFCPAAFFGNFPLCLPSWCRDRSVSVCLSVLECENKGLLSPHISFTIGMRPADRPSGKCTMPVVFLWKLGVFVFTPAETIIWCSDNDRIV